MLLRREAVLESEGIERLHNLVLLAVLHWKGAVGRRSRPVKAQFAPRLPQIEFRKRISMIAMIAIRLASRCSVFWWNSNAARGCGVLVQFAQNFGETAVW